MNLYYNNDDGEIILIKAESKKQAREKLKGMCARRGWYSGYADDAEITIVHFDENGCVFMEAN